LKFQLHVCHARCRLLRGYHDGKEAERIITVTPTIAHPAYSTVTPWEFVMARALIGNIVPSSVNRTGIACGSY
jgi:hypothetical protein